MVYINITIVISTAFSSLFIMFFPSFFFIAVGSLRRPRLFLLVVNVGVDDCSNVFAVSSGSRHVGAVIERARACRR